MYAVCHKKVSDCCLIEDTNTIDLRFPDDAEVPSDVTSHYCNAFTLPSELQSTELHMIGGEMIIDNADIVHHLLVYACPAENGKT